MKLCCCDTMCLGGVLRPFEPLLLIKLTAVLQRLFILPCLFVVDLHRLTSEGVLQGTCLYYLGDNSGNKWRNHSFPLQTGLHDIWATGLRIPGNQLEMEDFWAGALWALKIWLYLVISLIMIPAMFGFSLGISETYMRILVKTLEVLCVLLRVWVCTYSEMHQWPRDVLSVSCLSCSTVGHSENTKSKHRRASTQSLII